MRKKCELIQLLIQFVYLCCVLIMIVLLLRDFSNLFPHFQPCELWLSASSDAVSPVEQLTPRGLKSGKQTHQGNGPRGKPASSSFLILFLNYKLLQDNFL